MFSFEKEYNRENKMYFHTLKNVLQTSIKLANSVTCKFTCRIVSEQAKNAEIKKLYSKFTTVKPNVYLEVYCFKVKSGQVYYQ